MEPFSNTNTPPLSIAQADWTLYAEPELHQPVATTAAADQLALQEALLATIITRVGEVEAAEWALDQAKAECAAQITAALAAGVPPEQVVAAAGEQWTNRTQPLAGREPAPMDG